MLHNYFAEVSEEIQRKSQRIRTDFVTHKPSAGSNREAIVADFLREYLPHAFGIGTGLIVAKNGKFSDQADLVLVDQLSNAPLYGSSPESIWLVESVFALFEVKTQLTPTTINDAVEKCVKFKSLPRAYGDSFGRQKIAESLFVLWGFDAPTPATLKKNLLEAFTDVPSALRPDFVVVPGHSLTYSGSYLELTILGSPSSDHRRQLLAQGQTLDSYLPPDGLSMLATNNNTILAWLIWVISWLSGAGPRRVNLLNYVPEDHVWGEAV